jgi:hypothetical protein
MKKQHRPLNKQMPSQAQLAELGETAQVLRTRPDKHMRIWWFLCKHPYLKHFSPGERSALASLIIKEATKQ